MAHIMNKRGELDNIVTYEYFCDTVEDLLNIDPKYITLGTVAIVLQGDSGIEFYIATSEKEWILVTAGNGSDGGSDDSEEDDEEMMYEFEYDFWQDDGSNRPHARYRSVEDAATIIASIKQGKHVVFHVPAAEPNSSVGIYGQAEQYLSVTEYGEESEEYDFKPFIGLGGYRTMCIVDEEEYASPKNLGPALDSIQIIDEKLILNIYIDW